MSKGEYMTQESVIRVLIADDYDILRNGLAVSMRVFPDIRIVGEAATGAEAVAQCAALHPDVILMDLMMPGMTGVEACRVINEHHPEVAVIALTSYDNDMLVQETVKANAAGYFLKNVSPQQLADAIRAVHQGDRVFSEEAVQALVALAQRPSCATLKLTEREREVLRLIVTGASNSEIANALIISISTAKKHVSAVLEKLGVASRAEAIAFTLQNNLDLS